jgi:hypothetical protein
MEIVVNRAVPIVAPRKAERHMTAYDYFGTDARSDNPHERALLRHWAGEDHARARRGANRMRSDAYDRAMLFGPDIPVERFVPNPYLPQSAHTDLLPIGWKAGDWLHTR